MNDLSPPDAVAATTPILSPPAAEPSAKAETPVEPSSEDGAAPQEPLLTSGDGLQAELPPKSAAPPMASPPLESSARPEPVATAPPEPALALPPSRNSFALPLVSEDDPCGPILISKAIRSS